MTENRKLNIKKSKVAAFVTDTAGYFSDLSRLVLADKKQKYPAMLDYFSSKRDLWAINAV